MGVSRRLQEATGKVVPFAGVAVPYGWLRCNGQAVSRASYAALWAFMGSPNTGDGANTFNVPEMRGEIVRGLDEGRGVDAGRVLGAAQAGQMSAHTHSYAASLEPTSIYISTEPGYKGQNVGNTGSAGGTENESENRMRNIAFPFCIKT